MKSGLWQYSVRDGGDVVVVVDDDDGEGVIIIKQMVMLVQAFAVFLLCYVIGQYIIDTFLTEGIFYLIFFLGYFQKDSSSNSVPVINARHGQSDNDTAGNGGFDWPR